MDSLVTRAASLGHPIQRRQPSWRSSDDALEPLLGGIPARCFTVMAAATFNCHLLLLYCMLPRCDTL